MLRFFRKMRNALIPENRFGRYFLYAVGEIVLVVIGILIALQVNNWNEERKSVKLESKILKNLNTEFEHNLNEIKTIINDINSSYKTGRYVMTLISKHNSTLQFINIDSLLYYTLLSGSPFHPSENVLNELLNSGRLQLIRNDSLKLLLFSWSREKGRLIETFNDIDSKIENDFVPYLSEVYPLKDIDRYGILNWETVSTLKVDKYAIFSDLKFENLMDDLLYRTANYLQVLAELKSLIDSIIDETKKE